MNNFEFAIKQYLGEERLKKLQNVFIGIAGAGGLGSNCACNLVRTGAKKLKIIDFDLVQYSNLNRQFYFYEQVGKPKVLALKHNLLKINPDAEIHAIIERITEENAFELFKDCDIVIEAFDDPFCKAMLANIISRTGKLFICATGIAGWGDSDKIVVRKINPLFYVIGDLKTEVSVTIPPVSPRVNIASAKQADVAIECIFNKYE